MNKSRMRYEKFLNEYQFEIGLLIVFSVPVISTAIFYFLKEYIFINKDFLVMFFIDLGFSTSYWMSYFLAPGILLTLINSFIFRIVLKINKINIKETYE